MIVNGWKKAEDKIFSAEELVEMYTIACTKFIEEEFPEDGKTFSNFMNHVSDQQHMQMFSVWREGLINKDLSDKLPFKGPAIPKSEIKQSSFMNASLSTKQNSSSSEQTNAQEAQSHDSRTDCSATSTETNWSRPMTHKTLAKSVTVKPPLQRLKKVAKLDALRKKTDDYKCSHLSEKVKRISKKHDEK